MIHHTHDYTGVSGYGCRGSDDDGILKQTTTVKTQTEDTKIAKK